MLYRALLRRMISNINYGKDYYKVIGLAKSATHQDIRKAYLNQAKQLHPDAPNGNEEKFKQLGEAYEVLGNEKARNEYDAARASGATGDSQSRQYQQYYNQRTNRRSTYGEDPFQQWEEFFRQQQNMNGQYKQKKEYYKQQENYKQQAQDRYNQQKKQQEYQEYYYYEYYNPFTGKKSSFYGPNKSQDSNFREDFFRSNRGNDPFENFFSEKPNRQTFEQKRRQMYESSRMEEMSRPRGLLADLISGAMTAAIMITGVYILSGLLKYLRGPPPPEDQYYYNDTYPPQHIRRSPNYYDDTYPPPHSRRSPYSRDDNFR